MKDRTNRTLITVVAVVAVLSTLVASQALAADGALDASFGPGGMVSIDFAASNDAVNALAIQWDGKIVAAGTSDGDFALARFNTDGTLDATFGAGGKVVTPIDSGEDQAYAVAIQSDGKIVAAGVTSNGVTRHFALARFNTDGTLDASFGTGGKVTIHIFGGATEDVTRGVAIQSDGRIVAAGYVLGAHDLFALARFNTDGTLDTTFDGDGKVTAVVDSRAHAVAIQSDGRIVAAGYHRLSPGDAFVLARFNTDGSLDTTFDGDGKVITPIASDEDRAHAVALQSNGRIVAAGESAGDFALVRYNSDGSLDASFGAGGKVTTDFAGDRDFAHAVAIQCDGRIVVAGTAFTGGYFNFALARYNTDGTLDASFGAGGKVTTPFGAAWAEANAVAIQSDGKIAAAGYSFGTDYDFALARYESALPPCRPDAQIRGGPADLTYLGDGIYNRTAAGQTLQRQVRPGFGDQFNIKIENDGKCPDSFFVHGAGSSAKFKVAYWYGGSNVTPEVVAGTFETPELDAGGSANLMAFIYAKRGTRTGSWMTDLISVRSARSESLVWDVVGARVLVNKKAGDFNSQLPIP